MASPKGAKPALKYLALGDSYTIGEGVAASERWPNQLVQQLSGQGLVFEPITFIAQTGWTTQDLISAIQAKNLGGSFDIVSLLIGVNNQYQGKSPENYASDFEELLAISTALASGNKHRLFVLSIPDYSVTPFAAKRDVKKIADEICAFNELKKEISERRGIKYFNITPISLKAKNDRSLLAEDELHPSPNMYKEWTDFILPEIADLLR